MLPFRRGAVKERAITDGGIVGAGDVEAERIIPKAVLWVPSDVVIERSKSDGRVEGAIDVALRAPDNRRPYF